jgi:hypothetical protein
MPAWTVRLARLLRPDLPPAFVRVVERALAREPGHRFRSAAEMERALAAAGGSADLVPTRRAGPRWAIAAGIVAGAALMKLCWLGVTTLPRLLRPRFALAKGAAAVANTTGQTFVGAQSWARCGSCVCSPGDLDADGYPDLAVSSTGDEDGRGSTTVFYGLPDGSFGRPAKLPRPATAVDFGSTMCAAGDLNADGHPDLAVGAPSGIALGRGAGDVYLYFGARTPGTEPDRVLHGVRANQDFGYSLASGDVNGDGIAELIVGAPTDDASGTPSGRAFVYFGGRQFSGQPDLTLATAVPEAQFGYAVAVVGDVNSDGFEDIAVGAHWDDTDGRLAGRCYIYFGGRTPHTRPDLLLAAPAPGAWFGSSVTGADLNGDGASDVVVGAGWADGFEPSSGAAYVYLGGPNPQTAPAVVLQGEKAGSRFGERLAVADVNGDGFQDLLIGAYTFDQGLGASGAIYVYFGGPDMDAMPDLKLVGTGAGEQFGASLCALADLRGDGFPTLLVGAPGNDQVGKAAGAAYLLDFNRFVILRPRSGDRWSAGDAAMVSWLGAERANLSLSWDDGHTWSAPRRVGGRPENSVRVAVPAGALGPARLRLAPVDAGKKGVVTGPPIELVARRGGQR